MLIPIRNHSNLPHCFLLHLIFPKTIRQPGNFFLNTRCQKFQCHYLSNPCPTQLGEPGDICVILNDTLFYKPVKVMRQCQYSRYTGHTSDRLGTTGTYIPILYLALPVLHFRKTNSIFTANNSCILIYIKHG